jgi:hypothetical protein
VHAYVRRGHRPAAQAPALRRRASQRPAIYARGTEGRTSDQTTARWVPQVQQDMRQECQQCANHNIIKVIIVIIIVIIIIIFIIIVIINASCYKTRITYSIVHA